MAAMRRSEGIPGKFSLIAIVFPVRNTDRVQEWWPETQTPIPAVTNAAGHLAGSIE
ncbi:hypothetical protein A4U53_020855 [Rhizobium ruizarguesonis]|uniref:Uncharacterized protein n=1 Tax=Rhizobium ruizarguesonis TaxID=2081791 RepID=A0ACD5EUU9_9HYPH